MSVGLYMDVHVRWAITAGLRRRGVDVVTAQEDGTARFDDPALLDRATQLGRVLVSQDDDLLQEAARRQAAGERFSGVVYSHQLRITVRKPSATSNFWPPSTSRPTWRIAWSTCHSKKRGEWAWAPRRDKPLWLSVVRFGTIRSASVSLPRYR